MADHNIVVGSTYKLVRPTFLHEGILILQNSEVEVQELDNSGSVAKILYIDKEQNPHILEDVETKWLASLD